MTKRRITILLLLGSALLMLVLAVVTLHRWRTPRLPGLVLADPTPELVERFGKGNPRYDPRGPIVVRVNEASGILEPGVPEPGDWFEAVVQGRGGFTHLTVTDVPDLKKALRDFYNPSSESVLVILRSRGPGGRKVRYLKLSGWESLIYTAGY